ncbi:Hypothetical protein, putative [Bodo saltans]|uniref:Uncharacterized protein n=1 Tax=Bodo saltans TaxID=75058 RepID=A0A0S4KIF2_BODSA|nr:Hypothetical protein, putative [Bodo saltans]|eukprot:CUI14217.1 Hypothetical protein, putative [Bodo saltans]
MDANVLNANMQCHFLFKARLFDKMTTMWSEFQVLFEIGRASLSSRMSQTTEEIQWESVMTTKTIFRFRGHYQTQMIADCRFTLGVD